MDARDPAVPAEISEWQSAISVVDKNTTIVTIKGPAAAYDFLMYRWSGLRGRPFAKARQAALRAIANAEFGEEARTLFLAACSAADCLVRTEIMSGSADKA